MVEPPAIRGAAGTRDLPHVHGQGCCATGTPTSSPDLVNATQIGMPSGREDKNECDVLTVILYPCSRGFEPGSGPPRPSVRDYLRSAAEPG